MSKELVISTSPHETRVAILEKGNLVEIYVEREKEYALVGSIYKGRVTRVLPGMQSAFVDIGLDTDAFLYVSDVLEEIEGYDQIVSTVHVLVNAAMVIGFMPVTGIPLPLMSHGGSSILFVFLALGLVMNVRLRRFVN